MADSTRIERLLQQAAQLRPDQLRLVEQIVNALLKTGAKPVTSRPIRKPARSGKAVSRG